MIRAREGDHDAFARLAAASIGRLNGIARLILHDYAARGRRGPGGASWTPGATSAGCAIPDRFDPWLNRILVRSCQDARRRESRRGRLELPWLGNDEPASDDTLASIAAADQLERGLRLLTIEQRTVLVLAYYLDLPLADAAATLGIPIGTMKSRLNRSLAALARGARRGRAPARAATVEQPA